MDVQNFIELGGNWVKNPNYKKNNGQPKYIRSVNVGEYNNPLSSTLQEIGDNTYIFTNPLSRKLLNYGITPTREIEENNSFNNILADSQSNFRKAGNSLIQTVGDQVVLGTIKAFSDIADYAVNLFSDNNDYTNPLSKMLGDWQKSIREDIAPVYKRDDVDIFNGGLTDFSWYAANFPSIASSITLMIPGKIATKGLTSAFNYINRLGGKGINNTYTRKLARRLSKADRVSDPNEMTKTQRLLNSDRYINLANEGAKAATTAYVMRVAENYQEAAQTYEDTKNEAMSHFAPMSDIEFAEWKNQHKDLVKDNKLKNASKEEVASKLANLSANRTFNIDKINFFSDFAQVWGLRDAGKIIKNVTSKSIMRDSRKAIQSIGKTPEEVTQTVKEAGKFKQYSQAAGDILRGSGKTLLTESSEGIEEMINYIAQQEGITYGKEMLGTASPSTLGGRLADYVTNAELWESAFWGLAGGVVFQGLGSRYNLYQKNKANKKAAEERAENEKTKEKVETNAWYEADEKPEIAAARSAINSQNQRLESAVGRLKQIEDGKNIYGKVDPVTHELPEFTGSDEKIELDKRRAKASVIDEWLAGSVTDAVHGGTFDRFLDFISSDEMKNYMVSLNQTSKEESDAYIDGLVARAKEIKSMYESELDFMSNQAIFSNLKNKNKESAVIPMPYIVMAARQNLDRRLTNQKIDNQITMLRNNVSEILGSSSMQDIGLNSDIAYEDMFSLGILTTDYVRYAQQLRDVENDDTLSPLEKLIKTDDIKRKQKTIIDELAKVTSINGVESASIGRVLHTLRMAENFTIGENSELIPNAETVAKTDKELLENAGYAVSDILADYAGNLADKYSKDLEESSKLYDLAKQEIDANDEELKKLQNIHLGLYERYTDIANLKVLRALNSTDFIQNNYDFELYVDKIHNQLNEARMKAINENSDKIIRLYNSYKESDRFIIPNIIAYYLDGRRETAIRLANKYLESGDAVEIIDALDLFNFNSDNNNVLAGYLNNLIKGIDTIDEINNIKGKEDDEIVEESPGEEKDEEKVKPKKLSKREARKARRLARKAKKAKEKAEKDAAISSTGEETQNNDVLQGYIDRVNNSNSEDELNDILSDALDNNISEDDIWPYIEARLGEIEKGKNVKKPSETGPIKDTDEETLPIKHFIEEMNKELINSLNKIYEENTNATASVNEVERAISEVTTNYLEKERDNLTGEQYIELQKVLRTNAEKGMQQLNDFLSNMRKSKNNLEEAASNVAYMSKIGIREEDTLPDIFVTGIERFIDAYMEASLCPMINGKKVLDIREITYVVKNSLSDADITVINYFLNKLQAYLALPTNLDKYYKVNEHLLGNSVEFVNEAKDNAAIKEETTKLRVNIADYIDFYIDENQTDEASAKKYFNVLNSFKTGDTIDAIIDENNIYFQKDGVVIGSISKALYTDGIFKQGNKGFVEDITLDANGKPVSKMLNLYKEVLTSDKPEAVAIRELILRASVEGYTKDIVTAFENSDWIKNLKENNPESLVADGEKINKYGKVMLEHIVKLYNYNMQNALYKDKATKQKAIIENLNNYFTTLYFNYDAINRINSDTKFKISYINDGQVLTYVPNNEVSRLKELARRGDATAAKKVDDIHRDMPLAKTIIKDKTNTRISFTDTVGSNVVYVSNHANEQNRGLGENQAMLTVFDRNGRPTFVTTDYLDERDVNLVPEFRNLLTLAKLSIQQQLNKILEGLGSNESIIDNFNDIGTILASIINTNSDKYADQISLLRTKAYHYCNIYSSKSSYGYDEINLDIINNRNTVASIKIRRNPKNNGIYVVCKASHPSLQSLSRTSKYFTRGAAVESDEDITAVCNDIMNVLVMYSSTEISKEAIKGDNSPAVNQSRGLMQRRNGKFVTSFGGEIKEYDSYNDFIIDNNLIRVNMGSNPRTGNRVPRGSVQALNQALYIDATSRVSSPVEEIDEESYTPEMPNNNANINTAIYNAFNTGVVSGKDLFIAAYGQEAYDDFVNLAGSFNIIEELLPRFIKYHPRLNYEKDGKIKGPEASTNTSTKDTFVKVQSATDKSKRSNARVKSGQVLVGDILLKKLSSLNGIERKRGIAILMHERIHELIATNPNYSKTQILNAIRPIYEEFVAGVETLKNNAELYAKGDRLRTLLNNAYGTARYRTDERLLEEFLVETITNSDMLEVMNSIKTTDSRTSTEDNLFTKLMRFLAKWLLNLNINNGYLLEKEINVLNNLIDDKSQKRTDITKETNTVTSNATGSTKPIVTVILKKPTSQINDDNNDDDEFESAIGIDNNSTESVDGFFAALPVSEQSKFDALKARGAISYICR